MGWMESVDDEDEKDDDEYSVTVDENDADNTEEEVQSEDDSEASESVETPPSEEMAEFPEEDEEQIETDSEADNDEPEVTVTTGSEVESNSSEESVEDGDEGVSLAEFAPNSTPIEEAQEKDYRWRIMVWSDPSGGKTHFAHTMPEPIVFIDTESKAYDLSHKFDKEIVYYQPDDYDDAVDCLEEGIGALDAVRNETEQVGTIVVDSMSIMWEWSQQKYVDKFMPGKDASEVNFQSNMGQEGTSDWKQIKKFHNSDFRQVMTDTPYNLCWTAMREDDYQQVFDGGGDTGDKPGGEKSNQYKIDQVLRLKGGPDGRPRGYLQKSGFVRHEYTGLLYPDFHKHQEIMTEIAQAEEGKDPEKSVSIDVPYDIDLRVGGTN